MARETEGRIKNFFFAFGEGVGVNMWCSRCENFIDKCTCPDLLERLRDATASVHHQGYRKCESCGLHIRACKCAEPKPVDVAFDSSSEIPPKQISEDECEIKLRSMILDLKNLTHEIHGDVSGKKRNIGDNAMADLLRQLTEKNFNLLELLYTISKCMAFILMRVENAPEDSQAEAKDRIITNISDRVH